MRVCSTLGQMGHVGQVTSGIHHLTKKQQGLNGEQKNHRPLGFHRLEANKRGGGGPAAAAAAAAAQREREGQLVVVPLRVDLSNVWLGFG